MRLPSLKMGQREHFDGKNAPSVPKKGTVGALGLEKCAFRPKKRDRRRPTSKIGNGEPYFFFLLIDLRERIMPIKAMSTTAPQMK